MDDTFKQELFSAVLTSPILAPYIEQNSDLAELIKTPDHPDIHYYEGFAIAKELAPILKRRLSMMAAKNISHNLEAIKQLVAFAEEHPQSEIYNITFNCRTRHYGVRCGRIEDRLDVICVMTGGRIPDELLGEATL